MDFRDSYYAIYQGMECILLNTLKGWKLVTSNDNAREYGFIKNSATYSKILEKRDKNLFTAYLVRTKGKYKDFVFTIFQNKRLKDEHKVRLKLNNLDFEAYDYFGFPYRNDDASIEINEEELEEIWEERSRLASFPFKVDKIKYLKKRSKT